MSLDRNDPLAPFRGRFALPAGLIYLDGNSLGALPRGTPEHLRRVTEEEWGAGLISSWEQRGWLRLPLEVGDRIGRLLGARPGEVAVSDSTSVNLFKLTVAGLSLRPQRRVVLVEADAFPTDRYIVERAMELAGGRRELRVSRDPASALDGEVALTALSHVHYKTGQLLDMPGICTRAREVGALTLWDLAHSAGALPVDLVAAGADFAVGCGYKFLNGGPGAPSFLFVARRHQEAVESPLPGWLGHEDPFAFEERYRPATGIARFLCGTPPILALAALAAGIDLLLTADPGAVRRKSMALGGLFLARARERCPTLVPACPGDAARRGSQVSFRHPRAAEVSRELARRGVVGDLRPPDLLRFGLAPLYLRFADVWDAVEILADVLEELEQPGG